MLWGDLLRDAAYRQTGQGWDAFHKCLFGLHGVFAEPCRDSIGAISGALASDGLDYRTQEAVCKAGGAGLEDKDRP